MMLKYVLLLLAALSTPVYAQSGLAPANQVWAGPTSGSPQFPSFRPLVSADVPGGGGGGGIAGPGTSVVNDLAAWANTVGTVVKDTTGLSFTPGGPLVISPAAGFSQAINITQALSGSSIPAGATPFLVNITGDTAQCGGGFCVMTNVSESFGGAATTGGRIGMQAGVNLTAATSPSNTNHNYVGGFFAATAAANDNGTNTGAGALGGVFGLNPYCVLHNGATNFLECSGGEVNFALETGSSAAHKIGWSIVELNTDAVAGVTTDAGLVLSAEAGAAGLRTGISFSNSNSAFMVKSTGTLINSTGGSYANGLDFSASTFSGSFLKGPGVFSVDGSGNIAANNLTTAWTAFTPALSCGSATFSLGTARFKQVGKTVSLQISFQITAIGTCTNIITFTLPAAIASSAVMTFKESLVINTMGACATTGGTGISCTKADTSAFGVNQVWTGSGVYESI